ncbi:MAG: cupin domain-containing protein [Methylobacillus sp.]|jgi:50S ribosomal protein L16 3-hydroxylase|nr:cupin domain-containing protein [Methylobacillus sp.]
MNKTILGGLGARQFIEEYWQKKPLLVRNAFPGFGGMLTPNELAGLACEEDAQSRLVLHSRGKWALEQGPFAEERFARLPEKGWALLVQGVNHHLREADELLHEFDFIPRARLDDLMVSFAPDGGGVGPHFDSYDVFLLQGSGQRLWRVSGQDDMTLVPDAPLRILKNFRTDEEWLLNPGDMLYLPPKLAHWGIAVGDCMTWSVGFRAPSAQELATQFLGFMQERVALSGMYADPDLAPQTHPAELGGQMQDKVEAMLRAMRWSRDDVADFLGSYLTEPKPHIVFDTRRLSAEKFRAQFAKQGVRLVLKSQMLYRGGRVFINGEAVDMQGESQRLLIALANDRSLPPATNLPENLAALLHQWARAGWVE